MSPIRFVIGCLAALALPLAGLFAPGHDGTISAKRGDVEILTRWELLGTEDGLPHRSVRALCTFGHQLWIGTDDGLAMRDGGELRKWTQQDGLPWPAISAIDVDPSTHDVWLGTWGGGLVRLSGGRFDRFDQLNSGLAGDVVFAVKVVGPRVWAGTNAGLCAFDWAAGRWALHCERRADAPEIVVSAIGREGGAVVGSSWCEGVVRVDGAAEPGGPADTEDGGFTDGFAGSASSDAATTVSLATNGGTAWVSTQSRLWRSRDGSWASRALPRASTSLGGNIAPIGRSSAWLAADEGLLHLADWDSEAWASYRFPQANSGGVEVSRFAGEKGAGELWLPGPQRTGRIRCVVVLDGEVWAGAALGLVRGRDARRWDEAVALPGDAAHRSHPAPGSSKSPEGGAPAPGGAPIAVGMLGPVTRTVVLPSSRPVTGPPGRADHVAAQLAVAHAKHGRPPGAAPLVDVHKGPAGLFPYSWTSPEDEFITLARGADLVAMVGWIRSGGRAMSAVTAVEETPFLNAAATPPTSDELANPWVFRCRIDDPVAHAVALDHAFDALRCRRPVLVRTGEPVGDMYLDRWKAHASLRGMPAVADLDASPRGPGLAAAIKAADGDLVVTWTDEETSARILNELRAQGVDHPFLASDLIVTPTFLSRLRGAAGAIVAPSPCPHRTDVAGARRFVAEYPQAAQGSRGPSSPPPMAWLSYHAVRHLMDAIEAGGRNREALRRALEEMKDPRIARVESGSWRTFAPGEK